jgi:Armadillo/beta-catenin-like repeat
MHRKAHAHGSFPSLSLATTAVHKGRRIQAKRTVGDRVQQRARTEMTQLRKQQTDRSTKKRQHCAAGKATNRPPLHVNRPKTSHLELEWIRLAFRQWEERPSAYSDEALCETTQRLRHLIGTEKDNPGITQAVIDANLVPILVRLLAREHDQPTVYEAVYSLVNITYVTCAVVFDQQWAVPHLGKLVATSVSPEIREHAAWCLGNMVCESPKYRDVILEDPNALQGLYVNLVDSSFISVIRRRLI